MAIYIPRKRNREYATFIGMHLLLKKCRLCRIQTAEMADCVGMQRNDVQWRTVCLEPLNLLRTLARPARAWLSTVNVSEWLSVVNACMRHLSEQWFLAPCFYISSYLVPRLQNKCIEILFVYL